MRTTLISMLALVGTQALAAEPTIVVAEPNAAGTVGNITLINQVIVNDDGEWVVEVDTDNADTNIDAALVSNITGAVEVISQEGEALFQPAGALLDSYDDITFDIDGIFGWNLFLDGTTSTSDDSGLFLGGDLLIQEGDLSTSLDLSPGTPYIGFFGAKIFGDGELLAMTSTDDAAINSTVDRVLVKLSVDLGGVVIEDVVAKEGDQPVGALAPFLDFGTDPHDWDVNSSGQVLFIADQDTGDTATDWSLWLDDVKIANEGDAYPLDGTLIIDNLTSIALDLNDHGSFILKTSTDDVNGDDRLVLDFTEELLAEGDILADVGGGAITSFGTGGVALGNNGTWVTYVDTDLADTDTDSAIVVNGKVLLREGDALPDGNVADTLSSATDRLRLSPSGEWLIYEVAADDVAGATVGDYALLWNLSDFLEPQAPDPGVAGQLNTWVVEHAVPGHDIVLGVGANLSGRTVNCGAGTVDLDLGGPTRRIGRDIADATGTVSFDYPIPSSGAGRTLYLQAVDLTTCAVSDPVPFTL